MSFFSRLLGNAQAKPVRLDNTAEAFMLILYAVMTADHAVYDTEIDTLIAICRSRAQFDEYDIEVMLDGIQRKAEQTQGAVNLVRQAADMLSQTQREAAYICAVDLILSDGDQDDLETELLAELAEVLHITESLRERATDIISRKYKA